MRERPVRAGSGGWSKVPIVVASVLGVLGALTVGARVLVDRVNRATAWDQCERSNLDLVRAAGAGDLDVVRNELADGHDPDERDEHANTALGCAIPRHRSAVVAALLDGGADANRTSGAGRFEDVPIELAVAEHDMDAVVGLLDHGADPDRTTEGETPVLIRALAAKDDGTVTLLLAHGADPSHQGGTLPLVTAVTDGTDASVSALLDHGADPDGVAGDRPLVAAARAGRSGAVDALLAASADLTVADSDLDATPVGTAALAEAAGADDRHLVDALLGRGADPDAAATNGPLLRAVSFGHAEVVARLLDAGADPDLGTTNPFSLALTLTTINPTLADHLTVADPLAVALTPPAGSDPTAAGPDLAADPTFRPVDVPPIAAAIASGRTDVVALLLDHGADANRLADGRFSPLYLASVTCDVGTVELLLAGGADPAASPPDDAPASVACPPVRPLLGG